MANPEPSSTKQERLSRQLLRVLMVEDSPDDAELIELELTNGGYQIEALRVVSAADMATALNSADWDVIIADYSVPGFGAVPSLKLLRESGRDIPFIIVTGSISDEMAVASMRAGAHDYVLKDNLLRLVPAVEREIKESAARHQKHEAEAALHAENARDRSGNPICKAAAKYRRYFSFRVHGRSDLTYSWCEADRDPGKALHRRLAPANR